MKRDFKLPCICPLCDKGSSSIWMRGYGCNIKTGGVEDVLLCQDCAMQLVRKLSEDLCEFTEGGRHG